MPRLHRTLAFTATLSAIATAMACGATTSATIDPAEPGDDASSADARITPAREAGPTAPPDDDDASTKPDGKPDSGKPDSGKPDSGKPPSDAGTTELKDCGPPGQIFTNVEGPFCPFQAGGLFDHCSVGEHCCHYSEDAGVASTCQPNVTACGAAITEGIDWRCDEGNDCPGGQVCCFAGSITTHPQCLGQYKGTGSSTACRATTCLLGETRTCGAQADCPLGTTCTGMRMRGKHIGFCKP